MKPYHPQAALVPLLITLFLPLAVAQETPDPAPTNAPASEPAASDSQAEADPEEIFRLPEAEVNAERDTPELITREEMDRDGVNDLWEAVQYTPGVLLTGGGRRNESNFMVRGYGADSVPIFVDGILMANPYRGDKAR
jgi:iron complex outermembrane receptor protein